MKFWMDMESQLTERLWQMLESAHRHKKGLSYVLLTPMGEVNQYYTRGNDIPDYRGSDLIFAIQASRVDLAEFSEKRIRSMLRIAHRSMVSAIKRRED